MNQGFLQLNQMDKKRPNDKAYRRYVGRGDVAAADRP